MIYLIEIFKNAKVIMLKVVTFFTILLLSKSVYSQTAERVKEVLNKEEKDATLRNRLEPRISEKYYLGRFLIYDCEDKHFACVNAPSFFECGDKRLEDKANKEVYLSCVPLNQYESLQDCKNAHMSFIYRRTSRSFCLNKLD